MLLLEEIVGEKRDIRFALLERRYRPVFTVIHAGDKYLNVYLRRDIEFDRAPLRAVSDPECVSVVIHEQ